MFKLSSFQPLFASSTVQARRILPFPHLPELPIHSFAMGCHTPIVYEALHAGRPARPTIAPLDMFPTITSMNMRAISMDPDGSCLFHALADQILSDLTQSNQIRQAAVHYMAENRDTFKNMLPLDDLVGRSALKRLCCKDAEVLRGEDVGKDAQFNQYLDLLAENNTWGGEPEIIAIASFYSVPIDVHQEDGRIHSYNGGSNGRKATVEFSRTFSHYYSAKSNEEAICQTSASNIGDASKTTALPLSGKRKRKRGPHSAETREKISRANQGRSKGPLSAETREKLSQAQRGKSHSAESREKMSQAQRGRSVSAKTREKISQALRGKSLSAETREKISQASRGKSKGPRSAKTREKLSQANRGKSHSAETREKMSQARQGKSRGPLSAETREKISQARRGKSLSADTREKISQARRGKSLSAETREKISQSLRQLHPNFSKMSIERWKDPERRANFSKIMTERWKDPEYRKKMFEARNKCLPNSIRYVRQGILGQSVDGKKGCNLDSLGQVLQQQWIAISPQFEQVIIQLQKIQARQDQESSLLVLDTEYSPTKPSKLLEVGLVQLNSGKVLVDAIIDHECNTRDLLNLGKTVHDPAKRAMSMATLRKVYGSLDITQPCGKKTAKDLAEMLKNAGVSPKSIILVWHVGWTDVDLVRDFLELAGYFDIWPPRENCVRVLYEFRKNLPCNSKTGSQIPKSQSLLFPILFPGNELIGKAHRASPDAQMLRLLSLLLVQLSKPPQDRDLRQLPLATQEFVTSGRLSLTLLEKWLGACEKTVLGQFSATPNDQLRTQHAAKDSRHEGPGDEGIEEEDLEYAMQQTIERLLCLVLEDGETDLVIQDEELADLALQCLDLLNGKLESEGAKDNVENERTENEILVDPDLLVYSPESLTPR